MRVLQTLRNLERGGAETLVFDICQRGKINGLDVTLATFYGGTMEEEFRETGVDYFNLDKQPGFDFHLAYRLRKLIKKKKIQVIHTNQPSEAFFAYVASFGMRTKVVMTYHGFFVDNETIVKSLNFTIPRISANIFCSNFLVDYYSQQESLKPLKNKRVIYNGVSQDRLKITGKSIKKELGINGKNKLIGMVSNFRIPKDQFTVCQALPKIFEREKDAHFVFVGGSIFEGNEEIMQKCRNFCEEKGISKRVHFLGIRTDVADILSELDVFIFSSLHEGFPLSVIEAMLFGVPMVVSDIDSLKELSKHGTYAEIFPAKNSEILARKTLKLLQNKSLRIEMSKKTATYAREKFTIDAHINNLKKLYQEITFS